MQVSIFLMDEEMGSELLEHMHSLSMLPVFPATRWSLGKTMTLQGLSESNLNQGAICIKNPLTPESSLRQ